MVKIKFDSSSQLDLFSQPVEDTIKKEAQQHVVVSEPSLSATDMRFLSLGSGSSGNCYYLCNDRQGIIIDAGVDLNLILKGLKDNHIDLTKVNALLLTHDHGDHIRSAYALLKKFKNIKLFCTERVMNGILRRHNISRRITDYHNRIWVEHPFDIGDFTITAFNVPHDGTDNMGFKVDYRDRTFVIVTDLGHVNDRAEHYLSQAHYMVIESNYDANMLATGTYPQYLKSRIIAENGHLDNADAASFVASHYTPQLKYVFLCHLSKDNNTPEKALDAVRTALENAGVSVGTGEETADDFKKDLQLVALPRYDASRFYRFRE